MGAITIEEYVEGLPEQGKDQVREFIKFLRDTAPEYTEKICFSMPMWLAGEKMRDGYIGVSGAKRHFSVHFSEEQMIEELREMLPGCKTGKRCINIGYGDTETIEAVKQKVREFMERKSLR